MKHSVSFLLLCATAGLVDAHLGESHGLAHNHGKLARRANAASIGKRCKSRTTNVADSGVHVNAVQNQSTTLSSSATPTVEATSTTAWTSAWTQTSSFVTSVTVAASTPTADAVASTVGKIIAVQDYSCGDNGATEDITSSSGPNGSIDWLNCGVTSGGWTPPNIQMSDLVVQDLTTAVQDPNSPFQACTDYIQLFEKYAAEAGLPAIFVASIALQESSCNPNTVGGAGEQGLMQLTKDKCGSAPNGNCRDPDYNIQTGSNFLASLLASNDGNVLRVIGPFNGWSLGMTVGSATAAAQTSCCTCQNNLDYLHQVLNGWMQNIDPTAHSPALGKYFNLLQCY